MLNTPQNEEFSSQYFTGYEVRLACRAGVKQSHTSGLAPGHVQGNLVILPEVYASDFLRFCQRNPKACPLIAVSERGEPNVAGLGLDLDLCTDLPRYRVWWNGVVVDEPTDIRELWREDLFAFVIGCSFTFEDALMDHGIPLRHVQTGKNVSMYRTAIETIPAGPFGGPLVVSMRPMSSPDAIRAVQITSRYPAVHGAPIHIGDPGLIGIHDLSKPDYGDVVEVNADEMPVFWACGVTPQAALVKAKLPFAISHAPGCMLVTDRLNTEFAIY